MKLESGSDSLAYEFPFVSILVGVRLTNLCLISYGFGSCWFLQVKFSVEVPPSICQQCYETTLQEYAKRFKVPFLW